MDLNAAMIFSQVAHAGGFTAAANQLGIPKSTVSKKVRELEAELGIRLLNRTTRSLTLTEAGSRVLIHCREAFAHMEAAEREARSLQKEPTGMLTVAAPPAIAIGTMVPVIDAFMQRYPMVEVTLLSSNDLSYLFDGRTDVMIWAAADMPDGHAVKLVGQVSIGLFACPEYIQQHGEPLTPVELADHQAIAHTQMLHGRRFVWPLERGEERVTIEPRRPSRFMSNDAMAVLAAVRMGYGIGGLPLEMARQMCSSGEIQRVLPGWYAAPMRLSALFRDGASTSLKTRLFLDFLADWFKDERSIASMHRASNPVVSVVCPNAGV